MKLFFSRKWTLENNEEEIHDKSHVLPSAWRTICLLKRGEIQLLTEQEVSVTTKWPNKIAFFNAWRSLLPWWFPSVCRYLFVILFNRLRRRHSVALGVDKLANFCSGAFIITGLLWQENNIGKCNVFIHPMRFALHDNSIVSTRGFVTWNLLLSDRQEGFNAARRVQAPIFIKVI